MLLPVVWAEDSRPDKPLLVIMALNAEFLRDGVEREERHVNFPWKFSPTEAEEHMRELAESVIRSNPTESVQNGGQGVTHVRGERYP